MEDQYSFGVTLILGVSSFAFIYSLRIFMAVLWKLWIKPWLVKCELEGKSDGGLIMRGPKPLFPFGNLLEMRKLVSSSTRITTTSASAALSGRCGGGDTMMISHDIHSRVLPFFAKYRQTFGKVFVYWLGTEPFMYVAEPELIKQMTTAAASSTKMTGGSTESKSWGKPNVFKTDRQALFGNGLLMVEGTEWAHRKQTISRAISPNTLKAMVGMVVESTTTMLDNWNKKINNGANEIYVDRDLSTLASELIAKTILGSASPNYDHVRKAMFEKMALLQEMLFKHQRLVGVPYANLLTMTNWDDIKKQGKEIDALILSHIVQHRVKSELQAPEDQVDVLSHLLAESEQLGDDGGLVDECKTLLFSGKETTALTLTWTLLLLACHPEWQKQLKEEIAQVTNGETLNASMLPRLKKMGQVMNEALRLYSSAPNCQRQAREDIKVGSLLIPKGTNVWVDLVGMNHDRDFWGDDVNEFKPERFQGDEQGGRVTNNMHRMGFIPFGFGGRVCVGQNLFKMEYKVVLSMILTRFFLDISPNYVHSPALVLSLRPMHGVPLVIHTIQ